ncbi:putative thiamine biosynthetic bifunctional enzyme [Rhizoctonia solani]|nr:putative thiamine biosynthetic bifunctional enzyme [Rhizoctonia solani]
MTKIDYSLYLVTAREFLPPGKSIQGGVTVIQVREKKADTGEFLEIARRTKQICDKYGVPMFVNDRVDVALAVGATGVHLGQTDMPVSTARKLLELGHPDSPCLIGVSVGNVDEAKRAVLDGADYVGIGAIWDTKTKNLVKPVVGVRGAGDILDIVGDAGIPAVAIGGIKTHNALHTLHGAVGPITGTALSGLAIVTEIVSAPDASIPAKALTKVINSRTKHFHWPALCLPANTSPSAALLAENAGSLLTVLREKSPLVHQITNNVVIAQSANATLALGASPIMATAPEEMDDLGKVAGGLLVNFGTITNKAGMLVAGKAANTNKKPARSCLRSCWCWATQFRRETANELLNSWQASVIKGNAGEIGALLGSSEVVARGVDSTGPGFSDPANIVRTLAKRERCIVVMTGKTDYVSDGYTVVALSNGHSMLGDITGSGCIVGTAITAFAAASRLVAPEGVEDEGKLVRGDMFQAAVAGVLAITIASEIAAARLDVKGTGTFMSALIDELYNLKPQTIADRAMVEIL